MTNRTVSTQPPRSTAPAWTAGERPLARGLTATSTTHPGSAGKVIVLVATPAWGRPARARTVGLAPSAP